MTEWLAELRRLNANLAALVEVLTDLRAMLADVLHWTVLGEEERGGG